jgi:hypothetical protein
MRLAIAFEIAGSWRPASRVQHSGSWMNAFVAKRVIGANPDFIDRWLDRSERQYKVRREIVVRK